MIRCWPKEAKVDMHVQAGDEDGSGCYETQPARTSERGGGGGVVSASFYNVLVSPKSSAVTR